MESVLVGYGTVFVHIILERQVGDDDSVDATFLAFLAEVLKAVLHDRIQVAHQHQWHLYFRTDMLQLAE